MMELKEIDVCPSCGSDKLDKNFKNIIKCKDCNSKIGITNNKIWYEYIVKNN